jgi:hypothetical protein
MHDGISFHKILPKQAGYFGHLGQELTENNLENR